MISCQSCSQTLDETLNFGFRICDEEVETISVSFSPLFSLISPLVWLRTNPTTPSNRTDIDELIPILQNKANLEICYYSSMVQATRLAQRYVQLSILLVSGHANLLGPTRSSSLSLNSPFPTRYNPLPAPPFT